MAKRNPFLVLGILALLFGLVMLFVPVAEAPTEDRTLPTYWWVSAPALVLGLVLVAIGWRRYQATRQRPVERQQHL